MPGRGQPWKKGGHIDETIDSADIIDGTITEADLDSALTAKVNSGGHQIQEEGSPLTQRSELNFVGEGVTASDDGEKTVVTIPLSGGGGLNREDLASPVDDFWFYDEFFYPRPNTELPHFEKQTASMNAFNGVGGLIVYGTSSVANNVARLNICGAGLQAINSGKRLIMRCRVRTLSVANTALGLGFFADQSDGPSGTFPFSQKTNEGLGFFLNGSGNVIAYTDDTTTPVSTDTGVAHDTSMHTYEIDFDPAGTPTILFKIDGATVHTQTTNLPSFLGAWYCNGQTGTTSVANTVIDSLFIFNER